MRMLPLSATGGGFTTLYLMFICSLCVTVDAKEHQEQKPDTVERQYIDLSPDISFNIDEDETKINQQDNPDNSHSAPRRDENGDKGNSHSQALVNLTVQVDLTKYTNSADNNRIRRSADTWLRLLKGFKKSDDDDTDQVSRPTAYKAEQDDELPRPILVSLPVGRDSLAPMLILPIPVPTDSSTKCSVDSTPLTPVDSMLSSRSKPPVPPGIGSGPIMFYPYSGSLSSQGYGYAISQSMNGISQGSSQSSYSRGGAISSGGVQYPYLENNQFRPQNPVVSAGSGQYSAGLGTGQISGQNSQVSRGQIHSSDSGMRPGGENNYQVNRGQNPEIFTTETPDIRPIKRPLPFGKPPNKNRLNVAPQINHRNITQSESSQKLIELFNKQTSPSIKRSLESMDTYPAVTESRKVRQAQSPPGSTNQLKPETPRLEGSIMLRGLLTVPGSKYIEPYVAWWDEVTGSARIDMHGGLTSSYHTRLPDGRVQLFLIGTDRVGYRDHRYCGVTVPREIEPHDNMIPVFPNMENFTLADASDGEFGSRIERWTNLVSGRPGELGAAQGESLSFFHEVVLARLPNKPHINPIRYSVNVNSSVLGQSDSYFHRYTNLVEITPDPLVLNLYADEVCRYKYNLSSSDPRVDPLREFFLPHRDERYNALFDKWKTTYQRQYEDDIEEAVRKTQYILRSRFVQSGIRRSDHFYMELNLFLDRLDDEMKMVKKDIRKVAESDNGDEADPFPYSNQELEGLSNNLPMEFDWRKYGAVTDVREHKDCTGSWAIAVVEAMEGAFFVADGNLDPLDEQWINVCAADPSNFSGCQPNWPSTAYRYLKTQGILGKGNNFNKGQNITYDCGYPGVGAKRISHYTNVTSNSILALKVAIRQNGPVVVLLSTSSDMLTYVGKRGVFYDDNCPKDQPEHAMLAVGWGEFRGDTYFILKNSWSKKWGHDGYIRVGAGPNTCGILSYPSYPTL